MTPSKWTLFWLLLGLASVAAPRTVLVNGKPVTTPTQEVAGVIYLPVFPVARALGLKAGWNPKTHQVSMDGKPVKATGRVIGNTVYLPATVLAQSAHAALIVDNHKGTLSLVRKAAPLAAAKPKPKPKAVASAPLPPPPPPPSPAATPVLVPVPSNVPPPNNLPYQWQIPTDTSGKWKIPGMSYGGQTPSPSPSSSPTAFAAPPPDIGPPGPMPSPSPPMDTTPITSAVPYSPRISANGFFSLTVTNVETVSSYRSAYQPRAGYQFVTVYVSQQNISGQAQVYGGRFSMQDTQGSSYEPQDGLSNFWPVVLRPDGINFGYLTFEIPQAVLARRLVLAVPQEPLISINL